MCVWEYKHAYMLRDKWTSERANGHLKERMDIWKNEWTFERTNKHLKGQTDILKGRRKIEKDRDTSERTEGHLKRQTDIWRDRRTFERTDGQPKVKTDIRKDKLFSFQTWFQDKVSGCKSSKLTGPYPLITESWKDPEMKTQNVKIFSNMMMHLQFGRIRMLQLI